MASFFNRLTFGLRQYWFQVLIALFSFCYLLWLVYKHNETHNSIQLAEAVTGLITFLIALFVWFTQINREWEDSLSKRLTVQFDYDGRNIMECKEALLVGESDIRVWGQQIGQQMSFGSFLKFDPYIKIETPKVKFNKVWKKWEKHYIATFYLNELPDMPKPPSADLKQLYQEHFEAKRCLVWYPEYKEDVTLKKHEIWEYSNNASRRI